MCLQLTPRRRYRSRQRHHDGDPRCRAQAEPALVQRCLDLNHHLAHGALSYVSNPDAMAGIDWKEVPEDILTMIFEAVRGDGYAIALTSVIKVCRRWHVSTVQDYCSST
jgi:hypothetical protein